MRRRAAASRRWPCPTAQPCIRCRTGISSLSARDALRAERRVTRRASPRSLGSSEHPATALRQKEQRGPVTTQARRPLLPDKLSHEHDSSQAAANGASRHAAIARPSPLAIAPAAAATAEAIVRAVGELSGAAHTKRRHRHSRRGPPSDVESTRAELFRGLLASAVPAIGFTR